MTYLIRGDGGTLDSNFAFLNGLGAIQSDLVVSGISTFDT
jgi:hypothetical protein